MDAGGDGARRSSRSARHNISYAHRDEDVDGLSDVYDEVFPILREAVENRAIRQYLKCEPLRAASAKARL